jgi:3D (Asp-Asp-Asp) domain-containing protein
MKYVWVYLLGVVVAALFGGYTGHKQTTKINAQQVEINALEQDNSYLVNEIERDDAIFMSVFGDDWKREKVLYRTAVTVTAYSSTVGQTDSTPHQTADMSIVRVGIIAVSRDVLTELGLVMGQRVLLPGYGMFEVRDKMNKRYRRRVDIWMSDKRAADLHGVKQSVLMWFGQGGKT